MHTNFDGHGFIGFRDIATFKNSQISLSDHELYIYSPWSQRKILAVFESSNISEINKTMLIKIGVHAFDINPYLHIFFEPILIDSIFHYHGLYIVHGIEMPITLHCRIAQIFFMQSN